MTTSLPYPLKLLILKARRIIESEIRWALEPFIEKQRLLNTTSTAAIQTMWELVRDSEQDEKLAMLHNKLELMKKRNYASTSTTRAVESSPGWLHQLDIEKIAYRWNSPLSERFAEYLWAACNLTDAGRVLDVGCVGSMLPQALVELGPLEIYGIDIRPYDSPRFEFHQEDILETQFPDEFFDQVLAISTIGYAGLESNRNKELHVGSDRKVMERILRLLKHDGSALVTVPYGIGQGWSCRTYDEQTLSKLFEGFEIEKKLFLIRKYGLWIETTEDEARTADCRPIATAIVCVKAKRG